VSRVDVSSTAAPGARRGADRRLRHYAEDFDARIGFLVGTPDQCRAAAKAYRVYTSVAKEDAETDDYLLDHSIVLYFVGPDGGFLDFFTQSTPPSTIVEKIMGHHQRLKG